VRGEGKPMEHETKKQSDIEKRAAWKEGGKQALLGMAS